MKLSTKHLPFWLITLSMFVALILPTLLQDGMFMDGLLYTSVSKNLADGIGTFWFPHFSQTLHPLFNEHPPLVFGIQSLFFKILGNSIYVERFYSFITACITGWLITLVWKQVFRNEQELKKLTWLPFFCWIIMPLTFWSFTHNMQENTMGIFTILSVYMIIKWFDTNRKNVLLLIISGVFIFLASFSKGVPGLFPLVVIGIYWIIYKNISFVKMLTYSIILILVPVIIYFVLMMLDDEIFKSFSGYLFNRAFYRIEHNPTVDTRFWIVWRLFMELLPVLILNMILLCIFKLKSIDFNKIKKHRKPILMFLLIGAAGSLPLMVTMVQKGFYMVHSFPFYAIGLAIIVAPGIAELLIQINTKRKSFKIFQIISIILIISTITFSFLQIGKTKRDKDKIYDVHLIGEVVPRGSIIGIAPSLWQDWSLHGYFVRHYYISLGQTDQPYEYLLREKMLQIPVSEKYQKTYLATKKYDLYQLK